MSVLLPAPFSPNSVCTSPARTSKSTRSLATTPGKRFVMPRISSNGSASPAAPAVFPGVVASTVIWLVSRRRSCRVTIPATTFFAVCLDLASAVIAAVELDLLAAVLQQISVRDTAELPGLDARDDLVEDGIQS